VRRVQAPTWHRAQAIFRDSDRGDVVGWVITLPVALLLFVAAIQAGLWYQARAMCQAAAVTGVQAGKAFNAPPGTGSAAASAYLKVTADNTVSDTQVSEQLSASAVTVSCTGAALTVVPLPGLTTVAQSSTAQRERFTTPGTP
jgi:hypothetical protein